MTTQLFTGELGVVHKPRHREVVDVPSKRKETGRAPASSLQAHRGGPSGKLETRSAQVRLLLAPPGESVVN